MALAWNRKMPAGKEDISLASQDLAARRGSVSRLLLWAIFGCAGLLCLLYCGQNVDRNIFGARHFLAHDEAEHLHASYLLKQGLRPYADFIENHPMLFNHLLNAAFDLFGACTTRQQFLLAKILIYVHFLVCLGVVFLLLRRAREREGFSPPPLLLIVFSLAALNLWGSNSPIWEVRPDWLCHTCAVLCVYLHWSAHARTDSSGTPSMPRLLAAGILGGIGTAILPKTVLILLPYALVVLTLPSVRMTVMDPERRTFCRRLLLANAVFALVLLLSLCGGAILDLWLSRVSFSEYWTANFVMNGIPHMAYIPFANDQFNPIQRVKDLLSFGSALLIALRILFSPARPVFSGGGAKPVFRSVCYRLCFVTIIVCIILPSFTNRLVWPQYFAPALLALVLLAALAIDDFFSLILPRTVRALSRFAPHVVLRLPLIGALMAAVLLLYPPICRVRWNDYPFTQSSLKPSASVSFGAGRIDFLPDLFLPADLVYWTFEPQSIPVHARHWSYFFMLGLDRRFWSDVVRFGLVSDLDLSLRENFIADPPDVVALRDECDYVKWRRILKLTNSYSLDWLWPLLYKDYVRAERGGLSVLVHSRHSKKFRSLRWEITPLSETVDVIHGGCY
ncbi:MAG: hypothetical protein LLG06_17890 [Desulfobacteraceae bacterium]|nr:hypothetical protein [Desulfobacteraceae bacterium]